MGFAEFLNRENKKSRAFFHQCFRCRNWGEVVISKERLPLVFPGDELFHHYFYFLMYKKKPSRSPPKILRGKEKVLNYVVANAKYFGNSIGIAPHAEISDGEFAITNVGDISLLDYFKNIGTAKKCKKSIIHKFLYFGSGSFHRKCRWSGFNH